MHSSQQMPAVTLEQMLTASLMTATSACTTAVEQRYHHTRSKSLAAEKPVAAWVHATQ